MPEISIIIPVYNVEKYIKKCLNSVLNQTFKDIEIILVDDGSTDESGTICDEYALLDTRIRVFHKKNGGLSSARNYGIDVATGNYLGFVDSDDYVDIDMFAILYENIKREGADISICGIYQCYAGHFPKKNKPWYRVLNPQEAIYIAFYGKPYSVNAINKLYNRQLFVDIRYPEDKTTEDAFVIVDIFSKCKKIVATSEQKYYYFHREDSITTVKSASKAFDCIEAYERNKAIIDKNYPQISKIALSRLCWAYFYVLDKLLFAIDESEYIEKERQIIRYLRKETWFIVTQSSLSLNRKISSIFLLFSKRMYKFLLEKNMKIKAKPFS